MAKRNYKVHANIGLTQRSTRRFVTVLDTGAGPSFIRRDALPDKIEPFLRNTQSPSKIVDANKRRVEIEGTIDLSVELGGRIESVRFNVVPRLAVEVILGCDFCDKHVEAIRPRKRLVELDDGTTIPIVRRPDRRPQGSIPLPEEQEYVPASRRASNKVRATKRTVLKPESQTWVEVRCEAQGLVTIEPYAPLYETSQCSVATGVHQAEPRAIFHIFVANFSQQTVTLCPSQIVATVDEHPASLLETEISHGNMLGIVEGTKYRKRNHDPKDVNVINRHLAEAREAALKEEDEVPITAETIELGLTGDDESRIRSMLKRHESLWAGKLGEITAAKHHIRLIEGARPTKSAPYRAGPKTRELEEEEVHRQLEAGVIEPSNSEWAAPVLFAPKKDGKLRFCIDYRRLNAMTVKDSYPLPRMDECIDTLGDAKIFTTLDAFWGYWQIAVPEEDRPKTSFVCHAGQYQYTRMPFGLTNAPATFQRALDAILSRFKWKTCLVYIDDIIIFSKTVEEHIDHVDEILTALGTSGVTLKIKKCKFFSDSVEYLGHIIRPGKLEVDNANTKSLRDAKPPTSKTEIRSFLGLCNVYRRFIPNFAKKAYPLNDLLKKGSPENFTLNEEQLGAFHSFVEDVCSPPILALPRSDLPYSVDTDASDRGLGCTLFQTHADGQRKPVGYWSRSLKPAEKNYSASERECLAVVWALLTLRPYLQFESFLVFTDHNALRWLLNITEPSSRLTRWRLRLAEFDFEVRYKKGKDNHHADALSRLLTGSPTEDDDNDEIPAFTIEEEMRRFPFNEETPSFLKAKGEGNTDSTESEDHPDFLEIDYAEVDYLLAAEPTRKPLHFEPLTLEEIIVAQHSDVFCADTARRLNEGVVLPFSFDDNGLLVRSAFSGPQIVVPQLLKKRVLYLNHYPTLAGHPGGRKLYQRIRRHFYWPALAVDCYATVRNCPECARNRIKLHKNTGQLKLFPAKAPLESVCIDLLGELIRTPRGHKYLLVITDRFSKLVRTVPLKGITAGEVAKSFVEFWVFAYGPPEVLIADNGKQFTSKFFQDVCRILNIHNSFTTTYHPQTNGQVERFNRTILSALRTYIGDHPRDWDLYTSALTYAYNTQPQTSTSIAPFELVLSKPPGPLAASLPRDETETPREYKHKWKAWLTKTIPEVQEKLRKAQERYKKAFDKRLRKQTEEINANDEVFLRIERKDDTESRHKLAPIAEGPFQVKSVDKAAKTVVIVRPDQSVENVSRSRVVRAPKGPSYEQLLEDTRPMTINEVIVDFPAPEQDNLRRLQTNIDDNNEDKKTTTRDEVHETPNELETKPGKETEIEVEAESDTEEFVIEKIVDHKLNRSKKHRFAQLGETLYRIRWYGYAPSADTWEPIRNLPRSKVIGYYKRKKLPLPNNLDVAIDG